MKKVLILEDNVATIGHLKTIICELDIKSEIYTCDNLQKAYQYTLEQTIDLFIIDIILDTSKPGDASGLKFVESIRKIGYYAFTPVIFVTSLEDSRLYTYEKLHCYSFLEKPFDSNKLKNVLIQCLEFPEVRREEKTLYFRKDGIILSVESSDIVYIESMKHILNIYTVNKDVIQIPYVTLKKLLEDADNMNLIQCSRSTIINKKYAENIDVPNRMIQLKNGFGRVEIGIMYKKYMKEVFR